MSLCCSLILRFNHTVPLRPKQELIYKRGYGKVNKSRVALTDNSIVEGALGQNGERRTPVLAGLTVSDMIQFAGSLTTPLRRARWGQTRGCCLAI